MTTTEGTIADEIRSTSNDACVMALEKNWTAIIGAAGGEIAQWVFDFIVTWVSPVDWVMDFVSIIPIIGAPISSVGMVVLDEPFRINWSSTYANGAIGDIAMARNNANCAANVYYETREILKVDKVFASDADYYLNSIEASQQFYLALLNLKVGWIADIPFFGIFIGTPVKLVKWLARIGLPIITLMLQIDTEKLNTIENVTDQLKVELAANDGKLPESSLAK